MLRSEALKGDQGSLLDGDLGASVTKEGVGSVLDVRQKYNADVILCSFVKAVLALNERKDW